MAKMQTIRGHIIISPKGNMYVALPSGIIAEDGAEKA